MTYFAPLLLSSSYLPTRSDRANQLALGRRGSFGYGTEAHLEGKLPQRELLDIDIKAPLILQAVKRCRAGRKAGGFEKSGHNPQKQPTPRSHGHNRDGAHPSYFTGLDPAWVRCFTPAQVLVRRKPQGSRKAANSQAVAYKTQFAPGGTSLDYKDNSTPFDT